MSARCLPALPEKNIAPARVPAGVDPLLPGAQGLYQPSKERDSCGVGFVADMRNRKSHDILRKGLQILINLDHRGAVGADPMLGDGCGVLTQIPHGFFAPECEKLGFELPAPGQYAIGQFFMPRDDAARLKVRAIVEDAVASEGQTVLGWRDVPVDNSELGERVKAVEPVTQQIFIGRAANLATEDDFERRLFIIRKVVSNRVYESGRPDFSEYYPVSVSARTIVYKGMVLVRQLAPYYRDLLDPRYETALALVHQRFATNTFPSWRLAHPYRMIAHNGEINTLRGNVNWMAARQASVDSELFGNDISKLWPISYEGQ
ncbi:MAG TPA: glutamate synthase subunit alpha, partial [Roseiarcus sp.]|nr:glutamate synthase subunit alpha [Roseiarcus sp.]